MDDYYCKENDKTVLYNWLPAIVKHITNIWCTHSIFVDRSGALVYRKNRYAIMNANKLFP